MSLTEYMERQRDHASRRERAASARTLTKLQAQAADLMVANGTHPRERQALDGLNAAMRAAGFSVVDQMKVEEREAQQ